MAIFGPCAAQAIGVQPPSAGPVSFVYAHHEILMPVRIGDVGALTFLLDTDTSPSAIDLALARKLRLPLTVTGGSGSGVGGEKSRVVPVKLPALMVGSLSVSSIDALALDLSAVGRGIGRHIDGVLGTSFLKGRVIEIDYPCRRVSFPAASSALYTAHFSRDVSGENVSHDIWVGAHRVSATFDTGDGGFSFVSATGIRDLGLASAARAGKSSTVRGYNGTAKTTSGTLHDVRIGSVRIGSIATTFLPSVNGTIEVNIGNKTLEHFVVTFNYDRGVLTLSPSSCYRGRADPAEKARPRKSPDLHRQHGN
ncbi:MAG: aspartyl protease family protein [Candidatus Eremiobacteraeota bacterium]|nr:aspartyl protease family protein [Candidatus Eremiobacteraeota bacterium]